MAEQERWPWEIDFEKGWYTPAEYRKIMNRLRVKAKQRGLKVMTWKTFGGINKWWWELWDIKTKQLLNTPRFYDPNDVEEFLDKIPLLAAQEPQTPAPWSP